MPDILNILNILKLKDLYDLHVKLFEYQFVNVLLPVSLLRVFKYHGDEHEHNTKHSAHPRCPIVIIMHRNFLYSIVITYIRLRARDKDYLSRGA